MIPHGINIAALRRFQHVGLACDDGGCDRGVEKGDERSWMENGIATGATAPVGLLGIGENVR